MSGLEDLDELLSRGQQALEIEDYELAFDCFNRGAAHGNIDCQAKLGALLMMGVTSAGEELSRARFWLEIAARAGSGEAAHNLGTLCICEQRNQEVDSTESKQWYRLARELGFSVANDDWYS